MRETLHLSLTLPKPITSNQTHVWHIESPVSRTHHDLPSPGQDDVVEEEKTHFLCSFSNLEDGKYPSQASVLQPSPDPGLHTTCHSHDGLPSRQVSDLQLHTTHSALSSVGCVSVCVLGQEWSYNNGRNSPLCICSHAKLLLYYQAVQEKWPNKN